MPNIGMRIIKTAIAVFLCLLISPLRGSAGTPYYSAIAAIICMQPSVSDSLKLSLYRTVATLFGGLAGMLLLMAEHSLYPDAPQTLKYLTISACIVLLIYLTLVIRMPSAAAITCVVFLSTSVTLGEVGVAYVFALNRIIDTLIGIFVSVGVNAVQLPIRKRRDTLYLYDLDGEMSDHKKVAINRLTDLRRSVSVFSVHMPPFFPKVFDELKLNLPAIVMGGGALYHPSDNRWTELAYIPEEDAKALYTALAGNEVDRFLYTLTDDILHICYTPSDSPAQKKLLHAALCRPCINLMRMPADHIPKAVCLYALGSEQEIAAVMTAAQEITTTHRLCFSKRPFDLYEGYELLEIRRGDVSIDGAAESLRLQAGAVRIEYV